MRLPDIAHSTSFRLALLYAGLFAASALALFAVLYLTASRMMVDQLDAQLAAEQLAIAAEAGGGGAESWAAAIAAHAALPGSRFHYRLQDASGRRLAGDLPPPLRPGFHDLELPSATRDAEADGEPRLFRSLARPLPGIGLLAIATDAHGSAELRELIIRAFAWFAGATLLLAIAGGGMMMTGVRRRVEAINRASERIMAGDLGRRLPVRGDGSGGDEFDRLAANLNRMLDRIEQLVEGLRQVSTDIAHDLRTPLSRLRRTLDEVRDGMESQPEAPLAAIDRAAAEADELLASFGALLRIAQIEAGTARRGFAAVDLTGLLATVLEVYAPAAEEKHQMLAGDIAPGVHIHGDQALLTQAVANLVENAIRHSPPGSAIGLRLAELGNSVEVTVSDTGPGIPDAEKDKVLRRFYRLDRSRSTPGSGLGLALVAAICGLHGATLRLTDNAPRGLCVILSFSAKRGSARG